MYYTATDTVFFFGNTISGKPVNEQTSMRTTAVYSCVRILAETFASLLLQIYQHTAMGKEKNEKGTHQRELISQDEVPIFCLIATSPLFKGFTMHKKTD